MNDDDRQWQEQRREYDKALEQINKPQRDLPYTFTGCLPILVALMMCWIGALAAIYLVVAGWC